MMRRKFLLLGAILAGIAMAGLAPPARAAFELSVSDGTHTVVVMDNGTGDTDPTTGSIVVTTAALTTGGITGWSAINVSVAFSNLTSGSSFAMMELATSAMSNVIGSTTALTIDVTQTGFAQPLSAPIFAMSSKVVATSVPGTETVQGFYDAGNSGNNAFSVPGMAQTPLQTVTNGVTPSNPSTVIITPGISPFALDYREVLTPSGNGQFFSTDNELTVTVPEPSSMALIGCGALCLIGYARKHRKVAAA